MGLKTPVLLVDDDPEVVWGVGRCLTRAGYAVSTCGDGSEAIPLLRSKDFEILVTDIQMPRFNGLALIEWVHRNRPDIRIVAITAFGSPSIQQVALKKGAILYLEKPVDPDMLIEVLAERREKRDTFRGNVDEIDLFDYVQLVLMTRRKLILEVRSVGGESGRLYIDGGNVTHACSGDIEGEEAFFRCLSFNGGSFASLPWQPPDRVTVEMPGDFLLMEAARRKDEDDQQGGRDSWISARGGGGTPDGDGGAAEGGEEDLYMGDLTEGFDLDIGTGGENGASGQGGE
jgi:CheY-like chemotaxis protein